MSSEESVPGAVRVRDIDDLIYWRNVFQVLGIKRCHLLLLDMGVPADLASSPAGLVRAAQYFWHHVWEGITWQGVRVGQGYSDPTFPESYRLGIQSLLRNTFSLIARDYNEIDAHTLYTWADRNFVDQTQVNLWSTWSLLLSSFSISEAEPKLESLGASSSSARNIAKTVSRYFGPDARHHDDQLLARAKEIPLSPMEKEMVKLEVARPSDFAEVDLLDILRLVLGSQHAYQVWAELDKWIDESEREALLWWGYAEAAEIGMPVEHVILPGREGNIISGPSLSH